MRTPSDLVKNGFTAYQAKYYAHELQRSYASNHVGKLAGLLFDAQVEPKPHQIDAALFALQTPFLKGVILADEVGLGKTIEAGIVISQYWAERKRDILIIAPSSLRQQWQQELYEKFLIPSSLLDAKTKDRLLGAGRSPEVLICSYEFAQRHELSLLRAWDVVVADEAHRLRNFWNGKAKVANAVAHIVDGAHKTVLLTATPLQKATSLTRKTIIDILLDSGRLPEFIGNPNDFIQMVKGRLQAVLAELVTEGIQYEKIGGYVYELRELQKDGQEEKDRFLDQMYKLQNPEKSDFDYVVYDSEPERQFAELLDGRSDIKLFVKLPSKFKIDTPVGPYNPDWAIIKHEDGADRIYMIRETKSTDDEVKRRPTENAKIKAATKHFAAIGVGDYAVSTPANWRV